MAVRLRDHKKLNPEQVLLLACARSRLDQEHVARIEKALREGIAWEVFWPLARAHGVGYFVGHHLVSVKPTDSCPWASLPAPNRDQIQHNLLQETAHAMLLRDQQLRLNAELTRAAIPVLWLKGLILANRLYGRFDARHCGDLDLFTDPTNIPKVEELLARLGFERFRPIQAGKEYHPMAAHHTMWCARVLPDWQLVVELHERLSGPESCQPSVADLIKRSQSVPFHNQEFRVPSLEDELLILSLHAHHHQYALLRCLMDVAEFTDRFHDQLDWCELVTRAHRYRCLGRLRAALEVADGMLGLTNRDEVFSRVPALMTSQRWAIRSLFTDVLLDPRTQQNDLCQAKIAFLMDSWSDAGRMLSPRIFPSAEHVRSLCPTWWRSTPGFARVYYYAHAVNQLLGSRNADSLVHTPCVREACR